MDLGTCRVSVRPRYSLVSSVFAPFARVRALDPTAMTDWDIAPNPDDVSNHYNGSTGDEEQAMRPRDLQGSTNDTVQNAIQQHAQRSQLPWQRQTPTPPRSTQPSLPRLRSQAQAQGFSQLPGSSQTQAQHQHHTHKDVHESPEHARTRPFSRERAGTQHADEDSCSVPPSAHGSGSAPTCETCECHWSRSAPLTSY